MQRAPENPQQASRALRVLTLSSVFPNPDEPAHGIFVRNRLRYVADLAEVRVIAPVPAIDYSSPDKRWLRNHALPHTRRDGPLVIDYPRWFFPPFGTPLNVLCLFARTWFTVARIRREFRFDLIDAHFAYPEGCAAALLASCFRVPFLVTQRGNETLFGLSSLRRAIMAWSLKRAARVLSVSENLRQYAISLGVDPERTQTVPNGIDTDLFYPREREAARVRQGIPAGAKMILSAGTLAECKGHHRIVAALAKLRGGGMEAVLVIAGGASRDGHFEQNIRESIEQFGLRDSVRLTGRVAPSELAELMSAADVFCLASDREGWPNVVHEAQGCGAPVVATAVGGVPEMLPSEEYGYVIPPLDVEAMAAALHKALTRQWDREAISVWARSRSWEKVAQEVYAQMLLAVHDHSTNFTMPSSNGVRGA